MFTKAHLKATLRRTTPFLVIHLVALIILVQWVSMNDIYIAR